MKVKHYLTGPLQVNTYLAYDEATKKGFIVDPGGYESRLTDDAEKEHIEVEYIILTHGHGEMCIRDRYILDNSGTVESLYRQIDRRLERVRDEI